MGAWRRGLAWEPGAEACTTFGGSRASPHFERSAGADALARHAHGRRQRQRMVHSERADWWEGFQVSGEARSRVTG